MPLSPYRVAWDDDRSPALAPDRELATLVAVVWTGSVARVAIGVAQHAAFESELVLAVLAVFALPIVLMKS